MNPILYIIYHFLKLVTRICLWLYYPKTTVLNRQNFRFDRPTILVSNHPNTLLDPLHAAVRVPMIVHFLANAGLFKGTFQKWFFSTFFCIPVERPEDVNGRPLNNQNAFRQSSAFLAGGGCLYIAPEGTSFIGRRVRPLKTGAARIALNAESEKGFELGLNIMPVGLTYEASNCFHSRLTIYAGEPIWIKDYQALYQKDTFQAARQLTDDLEETLRSLVIHTRDEEEDLLIARLETLLRNSKPVTEPVHFARTQYLIGQLSDWRERSPQDFEQFRLQVEQYFSQLQEQRTDDQALARPPRPMLLHFAGLVLLFPVFLHGLAHNFLPAFLPVGLARRMKLDVEYNSTLKILAGLIAFPLFYYLQYRLIYWLYDWQTALIYLLTLLPLGLFAWVFFQRQKRVFRYFRFQRSANREKLRALRLAIWEKTGNLLAKKAP
ncbi:MAG: 1-acyl-sn-glycerol-3-phosphate acyltransferase [Lewinellaceae bacterium]|nr:1-acyl-sn-glycerol-3-phosphate acyltransferase [Phaeodactylibacter sp.]MCB9038480.1 1-acyl-sn-glycerol-3-phosphate acyltransferase [Lewinellaceae bacterium]